MSQPFLDITAGDLAGKPADHPRLALARRPLDTDGRKIGDQSRYFFLVLNSS